MPPKVHNSKRLIFITFSAGLFFEGISFSWSQELAQHKLEIKPHKETQITIDRIINGNEDEVFSATKKLKEMGGKDPITLVHQLMFFSLKAKNASESLLGISLIKGLGVEDFEIRKALVPLLEEKNIPIVELASLILFNIDGVLLPNQQEKIKHYRNFLITKKDTHPIGLVNYVFGISPSQALLLFDDIYWKQNWPPNLKWSDHIINIVRWRMENRFLQEGDLEKAQKELDKLSKHEGWYARRYVVEVIRGSPKLGTPELVKRLKNDPSPLVSEAAKGLK